jgi:hypothetical protein
MALFTILMEYKGGTYLTQIRAPSADAALEEWARGLEVKNIEGMTGAIKRQFVEWLPEARPAAVAGLKSTWCSGFVASTSSALVHIFRTTDRWEPEHTERRPRLETKRGHPKRKVSR